MTYIRCLSPQCQTTAGCVCGAQPKIGAIARSVQQIINDEAAWKERALAAEAERDEARTRLREYDSTWMLEEWHAMRARGDMPNDFAPLGHKILEIQNEKLAEEAAPLKACVAGHQNRWNRAMEAIRALSVPPHRAQEQGEG